MSARRVLLCGLSVLAVVVGIGNFFLTSPDVMWDRDLSHPDVVRFIVLLGVAIVGGVYLAWVMSASPGGRLAREDAERAAMVRMSGPLLVSGYLTGRVRGAILPFNSIAVSVYPGGILVKLSLLVEGAILASEIQGISVGRGRHEWIQIDHDAAAVPSPLQLAAGESPIGTAILSLAPPSGGRTPGSSSPKASVATWSDMLDRTLSAFPLGLRLIITLMTLAMTVVFMGVGLALVLGPESTLLARVVGILWTGCAALLGVTNLVRLRRSLRG